MPPPPTTSDALEGYKQKALEDFAQAQSYLNDKRQDIQSLYVDPAISFFASSCQRAPIATTFFTLLAALSFIPVATFLLFSLGTILVIGGGALVAATGLIGWLVGSAALLLVGALFVTTFLSVFATASLLAGYAVVRFFSIVASSETLPDAFKQAQEEASNLYAGRGWVARDDTGKKVRINGVVKQEGHQDVPVKLADGNGQS
ncbi:hypothetical protein JCM6882_001802 [Rhodosporidiobolus microsporus]